MLERGNVGARGDLGRGDVVRGAVARDEGDEVARGEGGDGDGGGRATPGLYASVICWWAKYGPSGGSLNVWVRIPA